MLAENFQVAVERPLHLREMLQPDSVLLPSLSIGFAIFPDDTDDVEKLCALADRRMYDDKRRLKLLDGSRIESDLIVEPGD